MALFKKPSAASDIVKDAIDYLSAPTGKTRVGASMALPSDSTYFRNPYANDKLNSVVEYRDKKNKISSYDVPESSYQEAYDRAYKTLMDKSAQSGMVIKNPFYEIDPNAIFPRMPDGSLFRADSRIRGINDAAAAYSKDVQNMNLFGANSLLNYGSGKKFAAADTVGMTAKDRSIVEQGLAIARQIQAAKEAKEKAKKNKKK